MDSHTDAPPSSASAPTSLASFVRHLHRGDLRGTAQLTVEATLNVTRLVETVHAGVLRPLRAPSSTSRTHGLTGWIYRTVRQVIRLSGWGTHRVLSAAEQAIPPRASPESDARQQLLSILNGIVGDHLANSGNPLARSFSLRTARGTHVDADAATSGSLVVFVHGLCLSDRSWASDEDRPGHVEALTGVLNGTPVFARYNSGRPTRTNGRLLSDHLETLVTGSDRPSRIVLVTHSMGGLVARSALDHARRTSARWADLVSETIYLGTPHRGAPLERAGAWIESQLRRTRFTLPVADVASLRSRGIQDLGHGTTGPDTPSSVCSGSAAPPAAVPGRSLYLAAVLAPRQPTEDTVGDGLVPLSSALNAPDSSPTAARRVVENRGHLDLLHDPVVTEHLCRWLSPSDVSPQRRKP